MDFDDLDIAAQSSLQGLKKEIQAADPATLRLLMTEARTSIDHRNIDTPKRRGNL